MSRSLVKCVSRGPRGPWGPEETTRSGFLGRSTPSLDKEGNEQTTPLVNNVRQSGAWP